MDERETNMVKVLQSSLEDNHGTIEEQREKRKIAWKEFQIHQEKQENSNKGNSSSHNYQEKYQEKKKVSLSFTKRKRKLLKASSEGNVKKLAKYLSKGVDVNSKDEFGFTPLHFAALLGYYDMFSLILRYLPNVNAQTQDGSSALHLACSGHQYNLVEPLLEAGCDPFLTTKKKLNCYDLGLEQLRRKGRKRRRIDEEEEKRKETRQRNAFANEFERKEDMRRKKKTITPTPFEEKQDVSREEWLEVIFHGTYKDLNLPTWSNSQEQSVEESIEEKRRKYDEEWKRFTSRDQNSLLMESDIPWPKGNEENIFLIPPNVDLSTQKKMLREDVLRWHPDKFKHLTPNLHETILEKVKILGQLATTNYQVLRK